MCSFLRIETFPSGEESGAPKIWEAKKSHEAHRVGGGQKQAETVPIDRQQQDYQVGGGSEVRKVKRQNTQKQGKQKEERMETQMFQLVP